MSRTDLSKTAEAPNSSTMPAIVNALLAGGGLVLLLSGIAYYAGWARVDAAMRYFGVPSRILGISPEVVTLGAVGTISYGAIVFAPTLLAAFLGAKLEARLLRRGNWVYDASIGGASVAIVAAMLWVVPAFFGGSMPWWSPLVLLVVLHIAIRRSAAPEVGAIDGKFAAWAIVGVWVLMSFWWIGLFASARGSEWARSIAANPTQLTRVRVTSQSPLGLRCPGFPDEAPNQLNYTYADLYLLDASVDKLIVVQACLGGEPEARIIPIAGITVALGAAR